MLRFIALLVTACSLAYGADDESEFSLINLTKSPIQRIAGSVNIVSGDWVDQVIHHELEGPDPYVLAHSYISSSVQKGSLVEGWDLYHPSVLKVFQPQGIVYVPKGPKVPPLTPPERKHHYNPDHTPLMTKPDNPATLYYREAGGATIVLDGGNDAGHFVPRLKGTGYTLVGSIENPVRRDVRRIKIFHRHTFDEWIVLLSDGTRRVYTRVDKGEDRVGPYEHTYHIKDEMLPSGNWRHYSYDKDKRLEFIRTVSSDGLLVLHALSFTWKGDHALEVAGSDGLKTRFTLKDIKGVGRVVSHISRPGKPSLSFAYNRKNSKHPDRVNEKTAGHGRHESAFYYHDGENHIGKETIVSEGKDKLFLRNRVRELFAKLFPNGPEQRTHTFYYTSWDRHEEAKVRESDGCQTVYMWDKSKRPTWTGRFGPKEKLLSAENFLWDEGRLTHRTILDEEKHPLLDRSWTYDAKGNVIKEVIQGSFSGRPHKALSIDGEKRVHGGEPLVRKARYSPRRSLKTAECDPLGHWTYYEYEPKRCLMTARLTCNHRTIIRREFFTHNSSAICTEIITDDGSSRDRNDLSGVTRRTITKIDPKLSTPFFGEPDAITVWVWTPEHGELLLRQEKYLRDDQGRVAIKEVVADGLSKRWTYQYDHVHRLVQTVDPVGHVESLEYDQGGRIARRVTAEVITSFRYDLFDRVVEEKKTFPDGSFESVCRTFDLHNRRVEEIDGRGRQTTLCRDVCGRVTQVISPALMTAEGVVCPKTTTRYSGSTQRTTSPTGAVTETVWSAAGKPLVVTKPSGAQVWYYYDKRNRCVEQRESSGLVTLFDYDALDRPKTRTQQAADGTVLSVVTKRYVGFDLVEETFPTKTIRYTYDGLGRKIAETVTDLVTSQTTTVQTDYDGFSRPIRVHDEACGTDELTTFDLADRVLEKRLLGADGKLLSIATMAYDGAGRVIESDVGRAGTTAKTTTEYGPYGLPKSKTEPDGTVTTFIYNPLYRWSDGQTYVQKVTIDARGVALEELLDANDQVRHSVVRDPFGVVLAKRTVVYSVLGKPIRVDEEAIAGGQTSATITTCFEYDSLGQCLSCTMAKGTEEEGHWSFGYDQEGRRVVEVKPSGVELHSAYDVKGRLTAFSSSDGTIAWRYRYNVQDLPEEVYTDVSHQSTLRRYDGLGHLISEVFDNGLSMAYQVAPRGHISAITYPDGSSAHFKYRDGLLDRVERGDYVYQVASRDLSGVITRAETPAGPICQSVDLMGRRWCIDHNAFREERSRFDAVGCCLERTILGRRELFTYDWLGQLTSDDGRSATYDSLHRRLESEGIPARHNSRNQVVSVGERPIVYDPDGRKIADGRFRYFYDACDRLVAVEEGAVRYEYTYDAYHRRLSTTTLLNGQKTSTELFFWQGEYEVGSVEEGRVSSLKVLGEGLGGDVGAAVLFEIAGQPVLPIHDLSGHVRVCLDLDGRIVESLDYTAFGLKSRSGSLSPWTFSSKRQDATGLIYFGRRMYDPRTATWLTQDPLGQNAGPNLYAYVKNNPLTTFDLLGLIDAPADRGFFDGFLDTLGGMVSGAWDMLSSCCSSSGGTTSCDSGSVSTRHSEVSEDGSVHFVHILRDGQVIREGENYESRILFYPHGNKELFFNEFAGQDLGRNMFALFVGIQTSLYTACDRASDFMSRSKTTAAVIIMYNSTDGWTADLIEATMNIARCECDVGRTLRTEFCAFVRGCQERGIQFQADLICHSQGVAIGYNFLKNLEKNGESDAQKRIGKMVNFGGPIMVPGAINYVAVGDPVTWFSVAHPIDRIEAWQRGEIRTVYPSRLEFPHNFSGTAYQKALDQYFQERRAA